ncbi:hypothetical protein AAD048_14785 [Raoultella ornithinolytica]|uniref:hypothetical protein n=1 Tax=Raoultella ornithinolytica TaxID=54291 RepID=UPI0029591E01|nr:hypothetical protein [Raoultella ornithinolytica]
MTRFFGFIAGQGEPVNGGWRERGLRTLAHVSVGYSVHHKFRVFLFPALQVNDPGPVSPGPGNPALRQEKSSRRDTFVSAVWLFGDAL